MCKYRTRMLRRMIAERDYYRHRAFEMGEKMGAWKAQTLIYAPGSPRFLIAEAFHDRYLSRMRWYAEKARHGK